MNDQAKSVNGKDKVFNFYVDEATKYGVNEAVFLYNLRFWLIHNQASGINYKDGRYWTFNTRKAYSNIFPFFSARQIRTIVDNLFKAGILLKGNYNKEHYDNTNWYSINEDWTTEVLTDSDEMQKTSCRLDEKVQGTLDQKVQALDQKVQPIPDINNKYKQEQNINKGGEALSGPTPSEIVLAFNEIVKETGIPRVEKLTDKRRDACNRITKKHFKTLEQWRHYFNLIACSRFLSGDNERGWTADIDFALTESKLVKVLEGVYRDKVRVQNITSKNASFLRACGVDL